MLNWIEHLGRIGVAAVLIIGVTIGAPIDVTRAAPPVAGRAAKNEAEIRKVLSDQTAAWNRGDLEAYMEGYWKSPELAFFAGGTITKGWEETLARYRKRYQGEGKEMGTLAMREVDVHLLDDQHALVRGRWHLALAAGKEAQGLFTLLVRRAGGGWRIVHDHSSAE